MECDINDCRPEYALKYLVQQVEEQSTLCDVTVKMGTWEKKFHRCVLVISPFFDHVLTDNFLEKQTGEIKMTIGTPSSLQTAIMYLYGQKPKFSLENIENVLQMAEFLLIPNLKAACITWLNSTVITENNCLAIIQISSIYDFEIKRCVDFIEENLPEMLNHPLMINLTQESVQMLFSDKRLSYAPMDDKLLFLLKWSDVAENSRKVHLKELLTTIDFNEISSSLLQDFTHKYADVIHLQLDQISPILPNHRVLIMKGNNHMYTDETFWCLDLEREQWFRIDSKSFDEESSYHYKGILGTCTTAFGPEIWFSKDAYWTSAILILNLQTDKCTELNIKGIDKSCRVGSNDGFKICGDMFVATINELVEIESNKDSKINDLRSQNVTDNFITMQPLYKERRIDIHTSTLYIGHIANGNVEMSPLLSFKDDTIHNVLIGQNTIAIIFKSQKFIAIYDLVKCNLEKIEQSTTLQDQIYEYNNVFLIYDNTRCIILTRIIDPCHSIKYEITEIPLEHNEYEEIYYCFKHQMLFRYYRKSYNENFVFECTPCPAVLFRKPNESITWKQLPLPREKYYSLDIKAEKVFAICLHKSMLRCQIDCPHCKARVGRKQSQFFVDDGMTYFDAIRPFDYYRPPNYDSDYCYFSD